MEPIKVDFGSEAFGVVAVAAVATWLLTAALKRAAGRLQPRHAEAARHLLPLASLAIGVAVIGAWQAWTGGELGGGAFVAAVLAAGKAVLGHSQLRELAKSLGGRFAFGPSSGAGGPLRPSPPEDGPKPAPEDATRPAPAEGPSSGGPEAAPAPSSEVAPEEDPDEGA